MHSRHLNCNACITLHILFFPCEFLPFFSLYCDCCTAFLGTRIWNQILCQRLSPDMPLQLASDTILRMLRARVHHHRQGQVTICSYSSLSQLFLDSTFPPNLSFIVNPRESICFLWPISLFHWLGLKVMSCERILPVLFFWFSLLCLS